MPQRAAIGSSLEDAVSKPRGGGGVNRLQPRIPMLQRWEYVKRNAGGGLVVHHKGVCEKSVLCYENHGQDSRVREIYCAPTIPQKAGTGGNNLPVVMRVKRRRADDDAEEGA